MRDFIALICAVEFIENNLRNRISAGEVAVAAHLSLSHLQSMFSRTLNVGIGEYITKRRLCVAARDLKETGKSVTDIAFDFGYANVESFTRAFKKQFLATPSSYRRGHGFSELYPRLIINEKEGYDVTQGYDLTEISRKILDAKGTYIICADVDHLLLINERMGFAAGDAAIAETAARIGKNIQDTMAYFRIGADHFVILTGSGEPSEAENIAKSIISYSDDNVSWSGGTFKFSVSMGIVKVPQDVQNAKTTIEAAENAMLATKKEGRNSYKVV